MTVSTDLYASQPERIGFSPSVWHVAEGRGSTREWALLGERRGSLFSVAVRPQQDCGANWRHDRNATFNRIHESCSIERNTTACMFATRSYAPKWNCTNRGMKRRLQTFRVKPGCVHAVLTNMEDRSK